MLDERGSASRRLTGEAHVLQPEFEELFTDEERRIARERLREYGYEG